jgi:hypothetical protein
MTHKRMIWKTISFRSYDDYRRIQSAWSSSQKAFGKNKVMNFDGRSEIETNISISGLRELFRHADVGIDWRNGILWDTKPLMNESDC